MIHSHGSPKEKHQPIPIMQPVIPTTKSHALDDGIRFVPRILYVVRAANSTLRCGSVRLDQGHGRSYEQAEQHFATHEADRGRSIGTHLHLLC